MNFTECNGFLLLLQCRINDMTDFREEIRKAVAVLRRGGIILYPTDTVWGIGCDATNSEAVRRIFELKRRADHKAMIVLVDSLAKLEHHADGIPDVAYDLIEASERPLTIVYDRGVGLAPELLGPDGSVGIRLTRESFSAGLCRALGRPLVSTSANISGEKAARCFAEISREITDNVDFIADYRREEPAGAARPSCVMRLGESGLFKILRP